jgi:hypothetical protein
VENSFHAIACEEFSNLLGSVKASIVRVDMQSSIRAPDLVPSPLGEWIKYMRDVMVGVKFHSLGKGDNPVEPCRIPNNCHHHFSRLDGDPLSPGLQFPQEARSARDLSSNRIRTHLILQYHVTLCLFGAGASRRVQIKVVFQCACQLPTEDVGSSQDLER